LDIPRFAGVNLIGGVNNAGKTGLLEAIYLLLERDPQKIQELPGLFRARSGIDETRYYWRWLACASEPNKVTSIVGNLEVFGETTVFWALTSKQTRPGMTPIFQASGRQLLRAPVSAEQVSQWPDPEVFSPRPTPPVEDAQVYVRATKKSAEAEDRIENLLLEIDDRVKRVRAFPDEQSNQPVLHIGLQSGPALPAPQFGQGFNRLLRIYSAILAAEARVFLIDEMETGLHHSVLPLFWKGLAALARREGVQIFATTHSREAIFAAHRVFSKEPEYNFAYHRLERNAQGAIVALTYDREALDGADEANFEVR
jgi:hypothetical protein